MNSNRRTRLSVWGKEANKPQIPGSNAGATIVELMAAVTIGLIMLLGITQLYLGSKDTYRIREDLGAMQESSRFGLETLTSAILMLDHWGGVTAADITGSPSGVTGGSGDCDAAWVTNATQPIFGAEGAANIGSVTGFQNCVASARYVPNSDVLIVRYADGLPIADATVSSTSNPDSSNTLYIRTSTGERGTLFWGGVNPASATGLGTQNGTKNYPYRVEAYFLRPCSVLDAGACTDGVPTLTRLTMDSAGNLAEETLVDGVEQIQFQYGMDANADGQVEQFVSATTVPNWNQVIAVRVEMLIRTRWPDQDYQDPNVTYTLAGGTTDNGLVYTVPAADRSFRRKQLEKVVQIRNRTRF